MSNEDKMDAIIIGAGPAGSACAYTLAKEGKSVLLIERGDSPGSKNVTGGRLYTYALETLEEGLSERAALERRVSREQIMLLSGNQSVCIDYHDPFLSQRDQVARSYTVLRAVFDEWLAAQAEEMGAMLACNIRVDELIEQDGKIAGVIAGEDAIYADVVIAADGVNSFMAQKAGLINDIVAHSVGVGVKEVIELPSASIEQRFNLPKDEGAARMILGCTEGVHGGGFLYTNKESISLGCVFMPAEAARKERSVHEIFQDLKMHPAIYPLLEGGQTIEYSAHLVPEMGCRGIPKKLYRDGFLMIGDAAGMVVNTGYSIRGIDLAIISGIAAARAVIKAANAAQAGPLYMKEMKNLKLLPSMKAMDGYYDVLDTSWLYDKVPNMASGFFHALYAVDGQEPEKIRATIMRMIKSQDLSWGQIIKFGYKGMKAL